MLKNKNNEEGALTITEVNNLIKNVISENIGGKLRIVGEVSNMKLSRGNIYMTLKDNDSMINAICWNSVYKNAKNDEIKDGNKIVVDGSITVYSKGGYYNINCSNISVVGSGDIHKDYMENKKFYTELGYFSDVRKKKMPDMIKKIGVITSLEGAALKDFLYVLDKGLYKGRVLLRNAVVQGKDCPKSVATSLYELDKMGLDVIIITRGGGSFEDLFGFSSPDIIEAIYKCKTCTISAIGHEVDYMLSDFVADIRAPTPSVAAEIIIKHQKTKYNVNYLDNILTENYLYLKKIVNQYEQKIVILDNQLVNPTTIINDFIKHLDEGSSESYNIIKNIINNLNNRCDNLITTIDTTNPNKVLEKGYCILVDNNNNRITSAMDLDFIKNENSDKKLKLIFIDGKRDVYL